ncbi:MAG: carbamoyltransferase HypF [Burkholderiaceae bacterium]
MSDFSEVRATQDRAELIRVRGLVQGVGFRPNVWRLARRYGLRGWVANDAEGVNIRASGAGAAVDDFVRALSLEAPPLARVDAIERAAVEVLQDDTDFRIVASREGGSYGCIRTNVVPDAASCAECVREVFDPSARRYRYPFTNCTHCGPRLSIVDAIPYDRGATTMRAFTMCPACRAEYDDPDDRRFHAQPIACPKCGPRAWLESADGAAIALDALTTFDAADAVCTLLQRGRIVAIKGLGGFQLACDARDQAAVAKLREKKHRDGKPFALMARDLDVIRRYCIVTGADEALLRSPAAPIVIMDTRKRTDTGIAAEVAPAVAPGIATLGFMLGSTPLHHLVLRRMDRAIVLTSGNLSDEPQCIANADACERLGGIADYFLLHDRDIVRRVDDSVTRVVNDASRILRRSRGYAPVAMQLPDGFDQAPRVLAMGAELKNTFCLVRDGTAIVSHHIGDLEEARTHDDYRRTIEQYLKLFEHEPQLVAVDLHPEYLSTKHGRTCAKSRSIAPADVQHHHAHIAACMAENAVAIDTRPVVGIALDGLGMGDDGALWGGEFLLADYRTCKRLATFKPVAMPGGEQAIREPWRNTYAHLMAAIGWSRFSVNYADLDLHRFLDAKPRKLIDEMIARGVNSPLASSCGRLFDAAAAAAGVCRERVLYEGQAAIEFEALVDPRTLEGENESLAYPFAISQLQGSGMPYVEPLAMWQALLDDLMLGTALPVIAARFHKGLAIVIARMAERLSRHQSDEEIKTVALSGGVFPNRVLFEQVVARLEARGFRVITHRQVPANDGGLSLGQAVVSAARTIARSISK